MSLYLLTALILSLSVGQLGRLELIPGLVVYVHDFFLLALLLSNLPKLIKPRPLLKPILGFTLAAVLSLFVAGFNHSLTQILTASTYLFRWLAYAAIYQLVVFKPQPIKAKLNRWLVLTGVIIALVGLIQYIFAPDMRFLYGLGWDDHYYRLIGTWLDPNFTGIILVLTVILLWPSPLSLLPIVALFLTYSRSSYLALLVTLVFSLLLRHKLKLFVSCFLFLVILFFLPRPGGEGVKLERLYSLTNRLDNFSLGWQIFSKHPLTGIGFNLLRQNQANFTSHSGAGLDNSLLFIAVTTGIFGLIAYLNLLYRLGKSTSLIGRLSLIAVIIHSFANNSLFYAPVMIWIWLLTASLSPSPQPGSRPGRKL